MKWLEVIRLRSGGNHHGWLEELLRSMSPSGSSGLLRMKTYRHAALETDLSIHLHWESERPAHDGSALGLRLAQTFKEYGMADHSVWVEVER